MIKHDEILDRIEHLAGELAEAEEKRDLLEAENTKELLEEDEDYLEVVALVDKIQETIKKEQEIADELRHYKALDIVEMRDYLDRQLDEIIKQEIPDHFRWFVKPRYEEYFSCNQGSYSVITIDNEEYYLV